MKKIFLFIIEFLFIFIFLSYATADKIFSHIPYKSAQWKSKTTITGKDKPITIEQIIFYKDDKMRTEAVMQDPSTGQKQNTITIIDDKFIYSYDKDKKQGTKISIESNSLLNPEKQNIQISKCKKSAIKKGNENINGIQCSKYEYNCKINGEIFTITEWRNKDGFPIKTISKYRDIVTTVETSDLKTNIGLSDSLFKPESDVKFMDAENMMQQMGKKMQMLEKQNQKNKSKELNQQNKENDIEEEDNEHKDIDINEMMKKMIER
ncbi:MAG: hypothetical protein N3E50_10440 [Candidatus Goldbacteria bacterium]|nr:hypothetical protein [Candidatus Goldiibacteriota bacterium]